jgi:hypothetical protein
MTVERWTDERLDELADAVDQTTHNIDLLVGAVNAFLAGGIFVVAQEAGNHRRNE